MAVLRLKSARITAEATRRRAIYNLLIVIDQIKTNVLNVILIISNILKIILTATAA